MSCHDTSLFVLSRLTTVHPWPPPFSAILVMELWEDDVMFLTKICTCGSRHLRQVTPCTLQTHCLPSGSRWAYRFLLADLSNCYRGHSRGLGKEGAPKKAGSGERILEVTVVLEKTSPPNLCTSLVLVWQLVCASRYSVIRNVCLATTKTQSNWYLRRGDGESENGRIEREKESCCVTLLKMLILHVMKSLPHQPLSSSIL